MNILSLLPLLIQTHFKWKTATSFLKSFHTTLFHDTCRNLVMLNLAHTVVVLFLLNAEIRWIEYFFLEFHFSRFVMLLSYVKLNCFKFVFFSYSCLHSIHHIDKAKTDLSQLYKLITNEN